MNSKKGSTAEGTFIYFTARIVIALLILTIIANTYLASINLKNEVDKASSFERVKSILRALDSVSSGEVTEEFSKEVSIEVKKNGKDTLIIADGRESKLGIDIKESGKTTSKKIRFIKTMDSQIEIKGA